MIWFSAGQAVRLARIPERDPPYLHYTAFEGVIPSPLCLGDCNAFSPRMVPARLRIYLRSAFARGTTASFGPTPRTLALRCFEL